MSDDLNRAQQEMGDTSGAQTMVAFPESLSPSQLEKQAACEHDWQRDGQTMTAVRWTCTKCSKTKLC
ncbi:MAG TPA: hypothetical protein VK149_00210 [Sideroxyarcus sp.]|nr:hypothetical protein [Sideroxyarcus sp.]